jgi:hypothetical protein
MIGHQRECQLPVTEFGKTYDRNGSQAALPTLQCPNTGLPATLTSFTNAR